MASTPRYQSKPVLLSTILAVAKLDPPDSPREIYDKRTCIGLRHQPSGYLGLYVQLGRGKRERLCDARDVVDPDNPLTFGMVKEKAASIRLQHANGKDFKAERAARRDVPTLAAYLEGEYAEWIRASRRAAESTLARLKACFLEEFGKHKLDQLTPVKLKPWRLARQRGGISPKTINRDMDTLRAMLTKAVHDEKITANPLLGSERAEVDDSKQVVRALTLAEKGALLAALAKRDVEKRKQRASANKWRKVRKYKLLPPLKHFADVLTPAVILSLETGLRRGELFALEWPFADLDTSVLRVEGATAKSFQTRDVPLSGLARETLAKWWEQRGKPDAGLIFTEDGGKLGSLKRSYHAVLTAAKIKRKNGQGERVNWHSLRHTFGSVLAARGADLVTVQKLMGHKDIATTQRYLHTDDARKRAAVALL
jgi:integrase